MNSSAVAPTLEDIASLHAELARLKGIEMENETLRKELKRYREAEKFKAQRLTPDDEEIPRLKGVDIYGRTVPFEGQAGGDILAYNYFAHRHDLDKRAAKARSRKDEEKARNLEALKHIGGIFVGDVTGHGVYAADRALMLYCEFRDFSIAEVKRKGKVTHHLFEELNMRWCKSKVKRNMAAESDMSIYPTAIYGEISDTGEFKFLNAGHPMPLIFSSEYNTFQDLPANLTTNPGFGTRPTDTHPDRDMFKVLPGDSYQFDPPNKLRFMAPGDMMFLFTDGWLDRTDVDDYARAKSEMEQMLRTAKYLPARDICGMLIDYRLRKQQEDDMTLVVIKYNNGC